MRLGDSRSHAVVDCIPVPPAVAAKAPLYFKKGIDDAESEWSQHHAKRMIETGGKVRADTCNDVMDGPDSYPECLSR